MKDVIKENLGEIISQFLLETINSRQREVNGVLIIKKAEFQDFIDWIK